jgi:MFS family permease
MNTFLHNKDKSTELAVDPMPHGIHNVYIFDTFNTMSWSVVLGTPMLLYLQHLNAPAIILAFGACLSPLLNILQIPAARYVERVGYRRVFIGGGATHRGPVIGMTICTLLPDTVSSVWRIGVMLLLLFVYNVLRGISVCGMLPWFTHIVPETRRGEFLAKDQSAIAFSGVISLFFFGLLLKGVHAWYSFGFVFSISAVAAFVSLFFLRRIPDVPVEQIPKSTTLPPWLEMFFYPPFFKYIRYNMLINMAFGASNVFWVRYFRVVLHSSDSRILFVACGINLALVSALFLVSSIIDRVNNKQVLTLSALLLICYYIGWASVAAGVLPFNHLVLAAQILMVGFGTALWNLANIRYVMGIVPVMGRPHFLALYSVASNITIGSVPLVWGGILDHLSNWRLSWGWWNWNSYSLFYGTLACTIIIGFCVLQTLDEPRKMTWETFVREFLVRTPARAVSRLLGRWRGPGIG